jgi:hypothetical protein
LQRQAQGGQGQNSQLDRGEYDSVGYSRIGQDGRLERRMKGEPEVIKAKFGQLVRSRMELFPKAGERLDAPDNHGVYIIYSPKGRVAHVGRTVRGKKGLHQRLNNHLHGTSSFVRKSARGQRS